ncbi:MAG: hypothetical protein GXY07_17845 [Candidatus Hydrogenedentes bacterium]|nr:hypothetical protein [Candidatus Hydrogenedentota bacterium]
MTCIIHITDLHFWNIVYNPFYLCNKRILGNLNLILRRHRYVHKERAQSFLQVLSEIQPDGILIGGDLTTTATREEFQQAANFLDQVSARCPAIYLLPGNHDYYTFESCRKHRFEHYCGKHAPISVDPVLSMLPGDISLIRIPTVRPNLITSRGFISEEQLTKVKKLLERKGPNPTLALAHYPVLSRTAHYHSGYDRRLGGASALRGILGHSGHPILYLAGHVHVFTHTMDPTYNNITHITTSALFYDKQKRRGGFTEIKVDAGTMRIFPWSYQDGWIRGVESHPAAEVPC